MKLFIKDTCIKCGICSEINGELFEVTKYGAIYNPYNYTDIFESDCYDAIFNCPVSAIMFE